MKIWTLMENTACREDIHAEHGLSLYIETEHHKILFDMGQSAAFAENAKRLGIDLRSVDFAVLSHGHYDHGGGLAAFLEINPKAPVYVSRYAFGDYYNASNRYIGLDPALKNSDRLQTVGDALTIAQGISLLSCNHRETTVPIDSAGLQKKGNGCLVADDFLHEQYLVVEERGKRICFSGCSHKGIRNILSWIPCDTLIGGFHFVKLNPQGEEVALAAKNLLATQTQFYTCHCTGLAQYGAMKNIMGSRLHYLTAGSCLEI